MDNFAISSLFPVITKTKPYSYFLPMPICSEVNQLLLTKLKHTKLAINHKQIENIKYISQPALASLFGKKVSKLYLNKTQGFVTTSKESIGVVIKNISRPHNVIARRFINYNQSEELETSQNFYYSKGKQVKDANLYLLLQTNRDENAECKTVKEMVHSSLNFLGDVGFGKWRSKGFGKFTVKYSAKLPFELPQVVDTIPSLLLSSWIPSSNEIKRKIKPKSYKLKFYQPISTRSTGNNPIHLSSTYYFQTGSIVKSADTRKPLGKMKNLGSKNNPNYFPGKAILYGGINFEKK